MKDFQAFLSLAMSLLTFLSFRPCFLGFPLCKLPLTLKVLRLLDQALYFFFFFPDDQTIAVFYPKLALMLFNLSSPKFLCRNPIHRPNLPMNLIILASFFSCLITPSSLVNQVWSSITPFDSKSKPLLAKQETKSLNLHHPFLILVVTLSKAHPPVPFVFPN